MDSNKIIRSVCYFTNQSVNDALAQIDEIATKLTKKDYSIQTKRICSPKTIEQLNSQVKNYEILLSVGVLSLNQAKEQLPQFYSAGDLSFNIDLTYKNIGLEHTQILFDIIHHKPDKTFNFTYVFNNVLSSPYFPSATYEKNGFAIGLQPTDLAENCQSFEDWFYQMKMVWKEIFNLFRNDSRFLGIDSSIAPLFTGKSSFINFVKKRCLLFSQSTTTTFYLTTTAFLKENNPKPIGLCGLMFPCLEDFELADEYAKGEFSIERNLFLSLHSGLGIDTYPIGIDEKPERVIEILKVIQGLSNKYKKPLSCRFVSDGKAKIGEKTDFKNQYLKDVVIRKL